MSGYHISVWKYFPSFCTTVIFLEESESCVYMEDDLFDKEMYKKRQLVSFSKKLGYVGEITPSDAATKK